MTATSLRVRVRMGVVALVTTVLVVPLTSVGAAQASTSIPYVPWSSYAAGWTDAYVPSSNNDCVAGRSKCLWATLNKLGGIADSTAKSCTHDAVFARAYLRMTQLYGYTRTIRGYYQDVPAINHLDAVFAKYYFDAYGNWKSGRRTKVPQSWLIALDAAKTKTVSGSGDLLLGMNAHINRDLAFVLAASGLVNSSHKADYDAAEQWLYDATAPLMAELSARFDPTMDDTADPFGLSYFVLFQMVSGWREGAWRNAEALVSAPTAAARAQVAAEIEAGANAEAKSLALSQTYTPPVSSTAARDAWCAKHKGAAPPMKYYFGKATAYGYAY